MLLLPISTLDQRVDIFTKIIPFRTFVDFDPNLGLLDIF